MKVTLLSVQKPPMFFGNRSVVWRNEDGGGVHWMP
jgi:hypothetical protein